MHPFCVHRNIIYWVCTVEACGSTLLRLQCVERRKTGAKESQEEVCEENRDRPVIV